MCLTTFKEVKKVSYRNTFLLRLWYILEQPSSNEYFLPAFEPLEIQNT